MIIKEVLIGFLVAVAANLTGMFFYISFFSVHSVEITITNALQEGYLGSLIGLGAIMNFLPFFVFLKKNQIYRVRGVVIATLLGALTIVVTEFI